MPKMICHKACLLQIMKQKKFIVVIIIYNSMNEEISFSSQCRFIKVLDLLKPLEN